ncbi:MAG: hypothetical protein ABIG80_01900 [Patescibacteria group bacterium]
MKTRLLILVKTYPTLSTKYDELVCTAGMKEDSTWIRIYPIPFRKLYFDKKYAKYQWIECELERNKSDFRPETYRPNLDTLKPCEKIETDKSGRWRDRRKLVLKNVHQNMPQLIADARNKSKYTSLAVFKPKKIIEFITEPVEREWDMQKLKKIEQNSEQLNLFKEKDNPFKLVNKLPFKFSYVFEDINGTKSKLMIEGWEIGALYWKELGRYEGDEDRACESVRKKYFENFAKTKDTHFFLGTTREHHLVGKNPFIIIGVFYPKADDQLELF